MANPKTAIARQQHVAPAPRPKAAPSPAQQAAREKFVAIAKRPTPSAAVTAPVKKPAPMAPRAQVQRDGLGKIFGGEVPTLIASGTLGALNESAIGEKCRDAIGLEASTAAFIGAVALKATGASNYLGSTVDKGVVATIKSESNDLMRKGGKRFVRYFAKKDEAAKADAANETKPASDPKPVVDTTGIEVKEVAAKSNGAANGVSSATAPKITHEKSPSANA